MEKSQEMIQQVVTAAREKFGIVMNVFLKEEQTHANFYFVAARRSDPGRADLPYMTITAKLPLVEGEGKAVSFFWGHYDLSIERVYEEINKARAAQEGK